jgi:hypothetical protein
MNRQRRVHTLAIPTQAVVRATSSQRFFEIDLDEAKINFEYDFALPRSRANQRAQVGL